MGGTVNTDKSLKILESWRAANTPWAQLVRVVDEWKNVHPERYKK